MAAPALARRAAPYREFSPGTVESDKTLAVTVNDPVSSAADAAGVPAWIPRAWRLDGCYYAWSEGSSLLGRLCLHPDADEACTIQRILDEADAFDDGDPDLNNPVAFVELRAGGANRGPSAGYGRMPRGPAAGPFTLLHMLDYARADLRRLL